MKFSCKILCTTWALLLPCIAACQPRLTTAEVQTITQPATMPATPPMSTATITASSTAISVESPFTLEKVDDHPLYVMHLHTDYPLQARQTPAQNVDLPNWGCSLFYAAGDAQNRLYGRNFDWQHSPSLLLFTSPAAGYASVSMVDLDYILPAGVDPNALDELSQDQLDWLFQAPYLPFDGMNEKGLTIGMAAVAEQPDIINPAKETVGSLWIMRAILDGAATTDEAVAIMQAYNITWDGGPTLHYLIADATGKAVLIEFDQGEMHILPNTQPFHLATNHLRHTTADQSDAAGCWRYKSLYQTLDVNAGVLDVTSAFSSLRKVAQENTQWSVVYHAATGEVLVSMGNSGIKHVFVLSMNAD